MQTIPNLTEDLIEKLDTLFPQLPIKPESTMAEIQFNAGQRELIRKLKVWWEHTKEQGGLTNVLQQS